MSIRLQSRGFFGEHDSLRQAERFADSIRKEGGLAVVKAGEGFDPYDGRRRIMGGHVSYCTLAQMQKHIAQFEAKQKERAR